jgi:hypothetical protein
MTSSPTRGPAPLERPGDSPRMREALRALEEDPLAHPVDPADRPPEGQVEVAFVGKLLGKRHRK